uniref:Death domain-containing protein n=1 Tax=Branchiostoma floridae TaxID=7739 RepID=C3ZTE4_BRAFL|eukprot:XP_002588180.1 hypothetical protein BRAFLDRAFT_68820 [Branchiostoma floridae]
MTEMKDLHKLLLRRYHRQLVRDMQTTRVLVQMLAVFDQSEEAEVLAGQTPTDRATRFLKILPQKGAEAFEAFVKVLEKKQPELARPLREEGLRESASSKNGGKDWKLVAERIGVLPQTAQLWEHNKARSNPAEKMLADWHKRPDATVAKLYQILLDCKMEDVADIL